MAIARVVAIQVGVVGGVRKGAAASKNFEQSCQCNSQEKYVLLQTCNTFETSNRTRKSAFAIVAINSLILLVESNVFKILAKLS
jgi:hypothetical protein